MKTPGRLGANGVPFWLALLVFICALLGATAYFRPAFAGTAVGAVGASVSIAVFLANRDQARRQTTIDLLAEYYSAEFAKSRRSAERFMEKHAETDWSIADPYLIDPKDSDLPGYGEVVRYWQRVAILDLEGELNSRLAYRLLSREAGYWSVLVFDPMRSRSNMYVRDLLVALTRRFSQDGRSVSFAAGETAGRVRMATGTAEIDPTSAPGDRRRNEG